MQAKKKKYSRRKKVIKGTSARPRLVVFRSNNNIFGQVVDDEKNKVLLGLSSLNSDLNKDLTKIKGKVDKAKLVGQKLAEKAKKKKIKTVIFDRNGYLYHGRIKAFADGAREGGLKF